MPTTRPAGADRGGVGQRHGRPRAVRSVGPAGPGRERGDEADDGHAVAGGRGDGFQRGDVVGDETRLEQEILRRVAGDRQFGQHADVGAGPAGRGDRVEGLVDVAVEIADDRIELGGGQPQVSHVRGAYRGVHGGLGGPRRKSLFTWRSCCGRSLDIGGLAVMNRPWRPPSGRADEQAPGTKARTERTEEKSLSYQAEYIWIDGTEPSPLLRSKTQDRGRREGARHLGLRRFEHQPGARPRLRLRAAAGVHLPGPAARPRATSWSCARWSSPTSPPTPRTPGRPPAGAGREVRRPGADVRHRAGVHLHPGRAAAWAGPSAGTRRPRARTTAASAATRCPGGRSSSSTPSPA